MLVRSPPDNVPNPAQGSGRGGNREQATPSWKPQPGVRARVPGDKVNICERPHAPS